MPTAIERRRALLVDAFTDDPLAGNAAGVVPEGDGLTRDQMRAIALELAAGETAFLLPSGEADRRIRFFAPTREVDRCVHATVAAHAHLYADGAVDAGAHTLATDAGVLEVEIEADGTVWTTVDPPTVREVALDYDRVADALGVDPATLRDVGADLPPAYASTGRPFLMIPVNFLAALGDADPDPRALAALSADHDVDGVYAFTFDTLESDSTIHARAFVPDGGATGDAAGVTEDPATGTASGACGAYLREAGAFEDAPEEMVFEQGHFLDRPARVRVRTAEAIRVGGRAATALDGRLAVPDADEGDIIEA